MAAMRHLVPDGGPVEPGAVHQIDVATSIAEVESMRAAWQAADVTDVDSDIDYFLTVIRHSDSVIRPHVVRIRRPGRPDLFGIARLEAYPVRVAVGYRSLARPTLRAVVATFGGIVGDQTPEEFKLVLDALRTPLASGEAEALVIRALDPYAGRYEIARRAAGVWRVHGTPILKRFRSDVPASLEDFMAVHSAKARATIRRRERSLERKYGDSLRLKVFTRPEEADELLRDTETIAQKTYQRGIGVGHQTTQLTQALTELGLRRGWLRAWLLYLKDVPVAFWTGWAFAGSFGSGTTGSARNPAGRPRRASSMRSRTWEVQVTWLSGGPTADDASHWLSRDVTCPPVSCLPRHRSNEGAQAREKLPKILNNGHLLNGRDIPD